MRRYRARIDGSAPATGSVPRRRAGLVGLVAAEGISTIGTRTASVAIPWLVLVTTDSPAKMGVVGGSSALAFVVASMFGAPLVDRLGHWRVSIAADLLAAAALVLIALGQGEFWLLVAMVAVVGALNAVGVQGKRVILQPLAEVAGTPMARVTAVFDGVSRTASLVGASVGGILIAWRGPVWVIWFNAVTFAVCALIVAAVAKVPPEPAVREASGAGAGSASKEPYLTALRGGYRYLRRDRLIFGLIMVPFFTNLINQAAGSVLIPLWAFEVAGSAVALGLVNGAFAGGAILGNIAFAALATRLPRFPTLAVGYLLGGAPRFLVLLLSQDLPVVLGVTFLAGAAISTVNPIIGALLYERVPRPLQARVFGLAGAVATGGMPLGGMGGGWAVDIFGLTAGLVAAAAIYFSATLIPLVRFRSWQRIDSEPPAEQVAGAGSVPSGSSPAGRSP
ncbi:MAG TPA: MFS transporter [Micromonosporaceae bacterium]|nr:MFS transporter [Micromonosporaceae bacterium]